MKKMYMEISDRVGRMQASCRGGFMSVCLLCSLLLTACSLVDEDLTDCERQAQLDYELRLVTNMTTELETQLTTQTDITIANELRTHLSGIFTDFAHDVDLSFYDTTGDSLRLQHDEHIMNANQASYSLFLPMRRYMHLATANVIDNHLVALTDDDRCHTSRLLQASGDTIDSHTTGLFTARQPMEVLEGVDQQFNVHLYMANCAAALVIDQRGLDGSGIKVFSTGFATGFDISDSTFIYATRPPIVRAAQVNVGDDSDARCFCSVTFPSPEPQATRSIIETIEPFRAKTAEEALWQIRVYVTLPGGSVTETIIYLRDPLRAGQLRIIKAWLADNGAVVTDESNELSTSVTLNWKEGLDIRY